MALPPPGYDPGPQQANGSSGGGGHKSKKDPVALMVGDPVHFAVQEGKGSGPVRHGSVVLFVDGDRALLASNPNVPNVKVIEVAGDRVGMSWVKTAYLGKGHKNCASALTLSIDAAWGLRSKILLTAGEVHETVVLSGRGSNASNTSAGSNCSGVASPNDPSSPGEPINYGTQQQQQQQPQQQQQQQQQQAPNPYGTPAIAATNYGTADNRPHDRELRAMVQEALGSGGMAMAGGADGASSAVPTSQAPVAREAPPARPPPQQHGSMSQGGSSYDPNMSRELRQLIVDAFDEGIQAFRTEQKGMDRWVGMLNERVNKVTGHFLMSFGNRLENEMDRRLNTYTETIRTTCASLQASRGAAQGPPSAGQAPGFDGCRHCLRPFTAQIIADGNVLGAGAEPPSALVLKNGNTVLTPPGQSPRDAAAAAGQGKSDAPQKANSTLSAATSGTASDANQIVGLQRGSSKNEHTMLMINKIKRDHERGQFTRQAIESSCGCYHKECIPAPLVSFVHSNGFNNLCAVVTLLFAIMVGVEVNLGIVATLDEDETPKWTSSLINIFNIWFAAEVLLRMITDGLVYFIGTDWRWNIFDLFLVILSILDTVSETGSVGFMRLIRAFKILKALRVVRVLRLFRELRLMVGSMLLSLGSLFWSIVFLLLVTYLMAVAITQAAISYIKDTSRIDEVALGIREFFDTLPDAMYSLILCITGGVDWKDAAAPVWSFGWAYGLGFMGFVLFCQLGILNVVTSVFVEQATNMKRLDRDFAISEELRIMERDIEETIELFYELVPEDSEDCNSVTKRQLHDFLKGDHVIAHFSTIGIDVTDPSKFAHLISEGESGMVSINAFVIGCVSLRGAAKQSDTLSIVLAVRKLESALQYMRSDVESAVGRMGMIADAAAANAMPRGEGAMSTPAGRGAPPADSRYALGEAGMPGIIGQAAGGKLIGSTDV